MQFPQKFYRHPTTDLIDAGVVATGGSFEKNTLTQLGGVLVSYVITIMIYIRYCEPEPLSLNPIVPSSMWAHLRTSVWLFLVSRFAWWFSGLVFPYLFPAKLRLDMKDFPPKGNSDLFVESLYIKVIFTAMCFFLRGEVLVTWCNYIPPGT